MTEMERLVQLSRHFSVSSTTAENYRRDLRCNARLNGNKRTWWVGILRQHVELTVHPDGYGSFRDDQVSTLNDKKRCDVVAIVVHLNLERLSIPYANGFVQGFAVTPEDMGIKPVAALKPVPVQKDPLEGAPSRSICLN